MNFFIVSAGEPGSNYIEDNFDDILDSNEFALHPDTRQKGTYYSIQPKDVLILKYMGTFVAYGIVVRKYSDESKNFSLRVEVEEWIFYDVSNVKRGVSIYGIQDATIGGGRYGTVKTVRPSFGLQKIREINDTHASYDKIILKENQTDLFKSGEYFNIHEELFNYLLDKSDTDPEFTFVIRDSNNNNSLEKGYWFFGEETLAISFWTGMDYINDRPAISFLINPNDNCKLVIQTDIYHDLKEYFIHDDWWKRILSELIQKGSVFEKTYTKFPSHEYIACLEEFLKTDYHKINRILYEENKQHSFKKNIVENDDNFKDYILKFPYRDYISRLNNIFKYRQNSSLGLTLYSLDDEEKADSIDWISIKDYGLIKDINLEIGSSKWVFITGENGSGKTMLLRAIGTVLGNRTIPVKDIEGKKFNVEANFISDKINIPFRRIKNNDLISKRRLLARGLAMYGPFRLQQASGQIKNDTFRKSLSKVGTYESLFNDDSKLLSLDKQLEIWLNREKNEKLIHARISQIVSLLPKIIPDLRKVEYKKKNYNKIELEYLIKSNGTDQLINLKWKELSSGNKSILNLVSDIIIRLYHQQPRVIDPAELRGIILIDEIDLHLHPKAQRDLVLTLSETFPLLQFIVTTHSPIPLLGAPEGSTFIIVERDFHNGIKATKLDIDISDLLPNTILASPIFGFTSLINIHHDRSEILRTENDYQEAAFYKILDRKIKEKTIELGLNND